MPALAPPVRTPLSAAKERKTRTTEPDGFQHRLPRQQLPSVADLSNRLYAAYEVHNGSLRLAGCALELRPIVHLKAQCRSSTKDANKSIELFLGDDGLPLEAIVAAELRSADFATGAKPQRFSAAALGRLVDRARWLLAEGCRENGDTLSASTVEIEVYWRLFAEGKLRFTIGESHVDLPFADWADRLQPPPFVCPETGVKTHRVAATDDGRIAAAEEIAACEQTGRRLLRSATVVCSVTGQRIAAELAEKCPIRGEFVQRDRLTVCPTCRMSVSPAAVEDGECHACAARSSVKKTDPRMCLIFGEHPGLERWRRWKLAETPQAYVLEGRSLTQRLLVVVDKPTLEVRRLAHRGRFQSAWHDVPQEGWREWLQ